MCEKVTRPCSKALSHSLVIALVEMTYTQTKKTVNTENISGMFIVF